MHTMNSYTIAYAVLCNIGYSIRVIDVLLLVCGVIWVVSMALCIRYLISQYIAPYLHIFCNIRKRNEYINGHRNERRR